MNADIVGIVGLPGSGKSSLIDDLVARGYKASAVDQIIGDKLLFDDINGGGYPHTTKRRLIKIEELARAGQNLVFSDILFCTKDWQDGMERLLKGLAIRWVSFENAPEKCRLNCAYRDQTKPGERNLLFELCCIDELTKLYTPRDEIRSVVVASADEFVPPAFGCVPVVPQYPWPL